jgi:DNA-directed RNA polymerase specialized sigma24 family protein
MNTHRHLMNPASTHDSTLLDDLDGIVVRASRGDRRAIAAIATSFGSTLLTAAREVLGPFEDEADDVLQDFLAGLVAGRSPFVAERGRAVPWMIGVVRAAARKARAARDEDWGIEEEP